MKIIDKLEKLKKTDTSMQVRFCCLIELIKPFFKEQSLSEDAECKHLRGITCGKKIDTLTEVDVSDIESNIKGGTMKIIDEQKTIIADIEEFIRCLNFKQRLYIKGCLRRLEQSLKPDAGVLDELKLYVFDHNYSDEFIGNKLRDLITKAKEMRCK